MDPPADSVLVGKLLSLASAGVAVALGLIATATVLLPAGERHRARGPLWLLLGHLAVAVPRALLPLRGELDELLGLLALSLLLLSLGHGLTLVLMEALLARRLNTHPPRIFRDIVSGLVYLVAALMTLREAGVDTSSLLTTSALLTAIVGLSLQDTLGNLFAGLSLQGERPFGVDDWIEYGQGSDWVGRVVEINWRATKVETLDQVELTIPNGQLARASILNYSRPNPVVRRSVRIVLPRETATGHVQDIVRAAIGDVSGVLGQPSPSVVTEAFEDWGVRYWVRFFIDDFSRRFVIEGAVRDRVWYALSRAGIAPAAPVREVHLHETGAAIEQHRQGIQRAESIAVLHAVDLLQGLDSRQLEILADASHAVSYSDGETVIRQGDTGNSLYVCVRGRLEIDYSPETGKHRKVATIGPGGVFGELSAMTGEPRTATVRATAHTDLLLLDKPAFKRVLADSPALAEVLSERLVQRRAELDSLRPAKERIQAPAPERDPAALLERIRGFFGIG